MGAVRKSRGKPTLSSVNDPKIMAKIASMFFFFFFFLSGKCLLTLVVAGNALANYNRIRFGKAWLKCCYD